MGGQHQCKAYVDEDQSQQEPPERQMPDIGRQNISEIEAIAAAHLSIPWRPDAEQNGDERTCLRQHCNGRE